MSTEWVRFDQYEDAVAALELVAELRSGLKDNPSLWKWVVMGAQNAMQAAMVLALQGTDSCGALRDKSQQRNREWLKNTKGPQPPVVMADYSTLLYRVQCAELMEGPPLEISAEEWQKLERLNKLRRDFTHFNPKAWSIELKLLHMLMPLTLSTIECLLTKQPRAEAHLTENQKARVTSALSRARLVFPHDNAQQTEAG
jgi:hypothetical protein